MIFDPSPDGISTPNKARIASVGRWLPPTQLTTEELMASTRHNTKIDLQRYTGVRERRVLNGEGDSHSLALNAARDALEHSDLAPGDIDAFIGCSITRSRGSDAKTWGLEPPLGKVIAQELGAPNAISFDVSNACAGMLTGLFVLCNLVRQGVIRRGMAVSGENIFPLARNATGHVRNLLSRELASLTVGDAGGAVIVEQTQDPDTPDVLFCMATVAKHSRLCIAHLEHDDPGARMFTRPVALHNAAMKNMPIVYQQLLETMGLPLEAMHHVIPHQTSKAAIKTGIRKISEHLSQHHLGQQLHSHAVVTVDRYGNTASTSHTVAFVEELDNQTVKPGERVVMLALASGLVIGAMVFTADEALVASRAPNAAGAVADTDGHPGAATNGASNFKENSNENTTLVGSHADNN